MISENKLKELKKNLKDAQGFIAVSGSKRDSMIMTASASIVKALKCFDPENTFKKLPDTKEQKTTTPQLKK